MLAVESPPALSGASSAASASSSSSSSPPLASATRRDSHATIEVNPIATSDDASSSSSSSSHAVSFSSSSSSSSSASAGGPAELAPSQQQQRIEGIPLAGPNGLFSDASPFGRCLLHLNLGLQDLRLVFMLLPCLAVLLFVTRHFIAALVVAALTFAFLCLVSYRLLLLLRSGRHAEYAALHFQASEGAGGGLGGARRMRVGMGGPRGLPLQYAQLLSVSRMTPTAMRLALTDRDFGASDYDLLLQLDDEQRVHTGLSQSAIDRLPTFTQPKRSGGSSGDKEHNCTVCLEPKQEGEQVRALLCLHSFHKDCIDPWLRKNPKCPVCQFKVAV